MLTAGLLLSASACNPVSMATRGLTEIRGAHGRVVPVREAADGAYRRLGGVELGRVANSIAPVCPSAVQRELESSLIEKSAQASADLAGDDTCTVEVDITFYQKPGGALAVVGQGALLVGRANLSSRQGGSFADLLVVVFSEAIRTTPAEVAEEFAELLVGHIRQRAGLGRG